MAIRQLDQYIQPLVPSMHGGHEAHVEWIARISHQSHDKMTADSHKEFLPRILKSGHTSILENIGGHFFFPRDFMYDERVPIYLLQSILPVTFNVGYSINPDIGMWLHLNARHAWDMYNDGLGYSTILSPIFKYFGEIAPTLFGECYGGLPTLEPYGDVLATDIYSGSDDNTYASFFINDCSRVTETQMRTHRTLSYLFRSNRHVRLEEEPIVTPPKFKNMEQHYPVDMRVKSRGFYCRAIELCKVPKQDARYYLPQGLATQGVITGALKWWRSWLKLRTASDAQWEIRSYAKAINMYLHNKYPEVIPTCDGTLRDEVGVRLHVA